MSDPITVTIPVTVTVVDFNGDKESPKATFTYSLPPGVDPTVILFKTATGQVTEYDLTPATDSPWTQSPLTPAPAADWLWLDKTAWTVRVLGNLLEKGASAGFRVSVVFEKITYVDDPTIIMVDPPPS
jgi:hypothetical protein